MCVGSVDWVDVFFFFFYVGEGASSREDALWMQRSLLETWFHTSLHSTPLGVSVDKTNGAWS